MVKYLAALLLSGCATAAPPLESWDRCNTGRVIDACSVDDYPPLMLAPWPFPRLLVPIEQAEASEVPAPQNPETPAGRLLQKLGK